MCNHKNDKRKTTSKRNGKLGGRPQTDVRKKGEALKIGQTCLFETSEEKLRFQQVNQEGRTGRVFKYGFYAKRVK